MLFDSGGFHNVAELAVVQLGKIETTLLQLCQNNKDKIRTLITIFVERLRSGVVIIFFLSFIILDLVRRGRPGGPRRTVNRAERLIFLDF